MTHKNVKALVAAMRADRSQCECLVVNHQYVVGHMSLHNHFFRFVHHATLWRIGSAMCNECRLRQAVYADVAAMTPNIRMGNAESEPRAFAALGGEEWFEDMRQYIAAISVPVSETVSSTESANFTFCAAIVMVPPSGLACPH